MASVVENCDDIVAHLAGVKAAVYEKASQGQARAEGILAAHFYQGHSRITLTRGSLDAFVSLDDSRGQHAAAAIEYGRSGGLRGGATQGVHALGGAF